MNSIIQGDQKDRCYICGRHGNTHVHHMLHGVHRKNADHYGLTVHLCYTCHMNLHDHGIKDLDLEQEAQRAFERKYGHKEFMTVFGRNWL